MAIVKIDGTPKEERLFTAKQMQEVIAIADKNKLMCGELLEQSQRLVKVVKIQQKQITIRENIILILGGVCGYYAILHHFF